MTKTTPKLSPLIAPLSLPSPSVISNDEHLVSNITHLDLSANNSNNTNNELDNIIAVIKELYNKYENDNFMKNKLIHHIKNYLPSFLINTNQTKISREERKKTLEECSDEFIEEFINATNYFYNSNIELFFVYEQETYKIISEDDILHHIRTTITNNKTNDLMPWKYKIKNQIIKKIKERDLLKSIPESETIQRVLNILYPIMFTNKDSAKHFLTIIGDILLKKNNLIFILNSKMKNFITELSQESCILFGTTNLLNNFKFKFYEHKYEECRLIDTNENFIVNASNSINIRPYIIDLFCVASHYSTRYGSSDLFLEKHCKYPTIKNHILYLKNNNEIDIVMKFINSTTENNESGQFSISWKNMLYLWKLFIEDEKIPNVFFNNSLKAHLIKILKYSEEQDIFLNITSKYLPLVSKFISFWNENIIISNNEIELEIDELSTLYIQYTSNNASHNQIHHSKNIIINDQIILGLIKHYFPEITIEENKYLINVGCKLWNKENDIIYAVVLFKEKCINEQYCVSVPLYNIYEFYCQQSYNCPNKMVVSKKYFEKFFIEQYNEFLDEKNFVLPKLWMNEK